MFYVPRVQHLTRVRDYSFCVILAIHSRYVAKLRSVPIAVRFTFHRSFKSALQRDAEERRAGTYSFQAPCVAETRHKQLSLLWSVPCFGIELTCITQSVLIKKLLQKMRCFSMRSIDSNASNQTDLLQIQSSSLWLCHLHFHSNILSQPSSSKPRSSTFALMLVFHFFPVVTGATYFSIILLPSLVQNGRTSQCSVFQAPYH